MRTGGFFDGLVKVLEELTERGLPHRLLFLEASDDILVNRYKETRRRHPLASDDNGRGGEDPPPVGGQVASAIAAERVLLDPLRERAYVSIDTTDLSAARLRKVVADKMLPRGSIGKLAITFLTYGFKHGAPRDADLLFDVRFLPNPHYESDLRPLTGLDTAVREYVESSEGISDFYAHLMPLLDYLLPQYEKEGKAHLTIGIGCTGGRHRSVVIAECLASDYGERDAYLVDVVHRDIDKPPRTP